MHLSRKEKEQVRDPRAVALQLAMAMEPVGKAAGLQQPQPFLLAERDTKPTEPFSRRAMASSLPL